MAKLIIWINGRLAIHGHKIHEFIFDPVRNYYVWGGKELDEKEFNAVIEKVMRRYETFHPSVLVTQFSEEPIPAPSPIPEPSQHDDKEPDEVAVERAVQVLSLLAPGLLKKKPGPKPVAV
jgi:DNA-binding NarL/FixJ family response regulator